MSGRPDHPLTEAEQEALVEITRIHVCPSIEAARHCASIPEGQPYRLHLLHALAEHFHDQDSALPSLLMEGVPAGIFDELPTSNHWQQRPRDVADDSLDNVQLSRCTGNWAKAERDPALLNSLLQKEIDAGHVKPFPGNRQDAEAKWPQRTAIGKQTTATHASFSTAPFAMPTPCAAFQSTSLSPPRKKCSVLSSFWRQMRGMARHSTGFQGSAQDSEGPRRRAGHSPLRNRGQAFSLHCLPFWGKIFRILLGPCRRSHPPHPAPHCKSHQPPQLVVCG